MFPNQRVSTIAILMATFGPLFLLNFLTKSSSFAASISSSSHSLQNPSRYDMINNYIIEDLIRLSTADENNRDAEFDPSNYHQQSSILLDSETDSDSDRQSPNDPINQEQDILQSNQALNDYLSLLRKILNNDHRKFSSNPSGSIATSDEFDYPQIRQTLIDNSQPESGWFEGPIIPKVSNFEDQIALEDLKNLDDVDVRNDFVMDNRQNYFDNNKLIKLTPNEVAFVDDLLKKYSTALKDQKLKDFNNDNNENIDVGNNGGGDDDEDGETEQNDRIFSRWLNKRRQKIVKHNATIRPSTSTIRPLIIEEKTIANQSSKSKSLKNFDQKQKDHITKLSIKKGQKEYPMLRPSTSESNRNKDGSEERNSNKQLVDQNDRWPSELEEDTLAEVSARFYSSKNFIRRKSLD